MAIETKRAKERRLMRRAKGLCTHCGELSRPQRATCEKCARTHGIAAKKWMQKKKIQGLCIHCGDFPALPTSDICALCRQTASISDKYYLYTNEQARLRDNERCRLKSAQYRSEGKCKCSRPLIKELDGVFKNCHFCRQRIRRGRGDPKVTNAIYMKNLRILMKEKKKEEKYNATNTV